MIGGTFAENCFFLFRLQNWWRHQMETFYALMSICAGNSPVPGEFPAQRPLTRSFDVFFDLRLNKRLSKQSWGWWFETHSPPLWRHSNEMLSNFHWLQVLQPPLPDSRQYCKQLTLHSLNVQWTSGCFTHHMDYYNQRALIIYTITHFTRYRWMLSLTHWGRVADICVCKLTLIGSDNGLSPDEILSVGPSGTYSYIFFQEMHLKMSSAENNRKCQVCHEAFAQHKRSHITMTS